MDHSPHLVRPGGAIRIVLLAALTLAMLAVLAAIAVGCAPPPVIDSGVQGQVWIGPVSPVEQQGVPNERPYSAVLRIARSSDGQVVATTTSGADGAFRVALAPGDYLLEPVNGDPLPVAPSQPFSVVAGRFTTLRVDYDSGIR
jgi:hypothetical protein